MRDAGQVVQGEDGTTHPGTKVKAAFFVCPHNPWLSFLVRVPLGGKCFCSLAGGMLVICCRRSPWGGKGTWETQRCVGAIFPPPFSKEHSL